MTAAAEGGQLQLNAFEPVIAHSILQSLVAEAGLMTAEKVGTVLSPERLSGMVAMTSP